GHGLRLAGGGQLEDLRTDEWLRHLTVGEAGHRADVVRDAGGLDVVDGPRPRDQEGALAVGEERDGVVTADRTLERTDSGLSELPDLAERGLGALRTHPEVTGIERAVGRSPEQVAATRGVEGIHVVDVAF